MEADNTALGVFAGIGQGTLSLFSKPFAGVAYFFYCPYDGIKNGVRNAVCGAAHPFLAMSLVRNSCAADDAFYWALCI
jgi:hypothetical protein